MVGTEFQINTFTNNAQGRPDVTTLENGNLVVVWENYGGGQFTNQPIRAQIYNQYGTVNGEEFIVSALTSTHTANNPSIITLNNGDFFVTWEEYKEILGQRYNIDGSKDGDLINITDRTFYDSEHSITSLDDGGYVIVWESNELSWGGDIFGRRFDTDGNNVGEKILINTTTYNLQQFPSIAPLDNGGFIVTWEGRLTELDGRTNVLNNVFSQRYNADGTKNGGEINISNSSNSSSWPSVATLNNGNYIIAWPEVNNTDDYANGFAQIFDTNGIEIGNKFQINSTVSSFFIKLDIAVLNDGGFVITFRSLNLDAGDAQTTDIYAQRFNADGTKNGIEILVNSYTEGFQSSGVVTALKDGGFFVAWSSDDQTVAPSSDDWLAKRQWDIYGQRFDDDGNKVSQIPDTDNLMQGDFRDDAFAGHDGSDSIYGAGGNDTLYGGNDGDTINGNQDSDIISGNSGDDLLRGGQDNDRINGNQGNDNIHGNIGDDTLYGGQGNDFILGDTGNDKLYGNLGNDTLTGGEGIDYFIFTGNSGSDIITDFTSGEDYLFVTFSNIAAAQEAFSGGILDLENGNQIELTGATELVATDLILFT